MFTAEELAEIAIDVILKFHVPQAPLPDDYSKFQPALDKFRSVTSAWLTPNLPDCYETVGVSLYLPKTAALAFDRIWSPPGLNLAPSEIAVYAATNTEVWAQLLWLIGYIKGYGQTFENIPKLSGVDFFLMTTVAEKVAAGELNFDSVQNAMSSRPTEYGSELADLSARSVAEALSRLSKRVSSVVPLYATVADFQSEFKPGDHSVVVAALQSVAVVDEAALTWDQILEFRKDANARAKYRRFLNWLNSEMLGKPTSHIVDEIAVRVDDYEWALRKHGITALVGTIERVLDPKFIAAASIGAAALSYSAGMDALLAASGILVAKAALEITKYCVNIEDADHGCNSEVAFIHAAKRLSTTEAK